MLGNFYDLRLTKFQLSWTHTSGHHSSSNTGIFATLLKRWTKVSVDLGLPLCLTYISLTPRLLNPGIINFLLVFDLCCRTRLWARGRAFASIFALHNCPTPLQRTYFAGVLLKPTVANASPPYGANFSISVCRNWKLISMDASFIKGQGQACRPVEAPFI